MRGLFLDIINLSAAASYMIAAVIVLRPVIKSPKSIRCLMWLLVLIRLVCPVSFTSPVSLIPQGGAVIAEEGYAYPSDKGIKPLNAETAAASGLDTGTVLTAVWLTGTAVMAGLAAAGYFRLKRETAEAVPEGGVYRCAVQTPFVMGLLRPRIYIPFGVKSGYAAAHERAHIERGDHVLKAAAFAVLCLHWFNPFVWAAYFLMSRDIEMACDERVIKGLDIQGRREYSLALLEFSSKPTAHCPLAFGEVGVKGRIKSILGYKKPRLLALASAALLCLAATALFMTNPGRKPDAQAYEASEIIFVNPLSSQAYMLDTIPYYYVSGDRILYQQDRGESQWEEIGTLSEYTENMDGYIASLVLDDGRAAGILEEADKYLAGNYMLLEDGGRIYISGLNNKSIWFIAELVPVKDAVSGLSRTDVGMGKALI